MALARRKPVDECDVVLSEMADEAIAGNRIVQILGVQGFCRVMPDVVEGNLKSALENVAAMDSRFYQPAAQVSEGLLGPEGSCRIAEMDPELKEDNQDGGKLLHLNRPG